MVNLVQEQFIIRNSGSLKSNQKGYFDMRNSLVLPVMSISLLTLSAHAAPGVHVNNMCYVKTSDSTVVASLCSSEGTSCSATGTSCTIDGYIGEGVQSDGALPVAIGRDVKVKDLDNAPICNSEADVDCMWDSATNTELTVGQGREKRPAKPSMDDSASADAKANYNTVRSNQASGGRSGKLDPTSQDDTPDGVGSEETEGDVQRIDKFEYRYLKDDTKVELDVGTIDDEGGPCPSTGC